MNALDWDFKAWQMHARNFEAVQYQSFMSRTRGGPPMRKLSNCDCLVGVCIKDCAPRRIEPDIRMFWRFQSLWRCGLARELCRGQCTSCVISAKQSLWLSGYLMPPTFVESCMNNMLLFLHVCSRQPQVVQLCSRAGNSKKVWNGKLCLL